MKIRQKNTWYVKIDQTQNIHEAIVAFESNLINESVGYFFLDILQHRGWYINTVLLGHFWSLNKELSI